MPVRSSLLTAVFASLVVGAVPALAQEPGIRDVTASDRSVIPLNTRLRYTTMIVLPDGEEILDVICGDRDFWVISAVQNVAHVKPAKAGAETNLNLVTARGTIYSFLLSEKSGAPAAQSAPDLKVYVTADPSTPAGRQKYFSAAEVDRLQAELTEAREATTQAEVRARELIAAAKQEMPTLMRFPYAPVKYERPFLVRAMWHDGQFTYLQSDARELPALYEVKDGKPSLVNFQVQRGTYVVPKVLERGYLALGNAKLTFDLRER
ncbi:MAG: TrbG/VirB9 family P-type conjugative transfer protein [Acidobacteria bacterium]|nr:TrbG/VirB9 family P-type conjugative transfer protein [Acidobacteriota bacterium]